MTWNSAGSIPDEVWQPANERLVATWRPSPRHPMDSGWWLPFSALAVYTVACKNVSTYARWRSSGNLNALPRSIGKHPVIKRRFWVPLSLRNPNGGVARSHASLNGRTAPGRRLNRIVHSSDTHKTRKQPSRSSRGGEDSPAVPHLCLHPSGNTSWRLYMFHHQRASQDLMQIRFLASPTTYLLTSKFHRLVSVLVSVATGTLHRRI